MRSIWVCHLYPKLDFQEELCHIPNETSKLFMDYCVNINVVFLMIH